ncbi:uncharacterized protein KY384_001368 [Bacidia gigantensis]|uniref:uncharacterized protein n=1 Tax=Bacidia gigantensis TaxID=2732470 RepID=UPI001D057AE5|nr:uncharacterized protein KY384_001368 [Bacidia gigantensis]KAG8533628.1 hypothetical protein KY384_001368 [Bacidia gigantensis]
MTDFGMQDIFSNSPAPTASIDACLSDGFHLDNGVRISDGDGLILVQGEAFAWRPWEVSDRGAGGKDGRKRRSMVNLKGQWDTEQGSERTSDQGVGGGSSAWGLLETVWPKPEMLILGLGKRMRPLSPATRKKIHELGIRVDVQDTRNAAAQFNLLATERGVGNVACALVPLGRRD